LGKGVLLLFPVVCIKPLKSLRPPHGVKKEEDEEEEERKQSKEAFGRRKRSGGGGYSKH